LDVSRLLCENLNKGEGLGPNRLWRNRDRAELINGQQVETADNQDEWVTRLTAEQPDRDAAIAELRRLLVRGLTKSLSTRYGSGLQAEDVVQDALLKILESLNQFEGRSQFTTWAMTIATRVGISELRRKHYRDVSLDSMTSGENLRLEIAVADDVSPADSNDRRVLFQKLQELIDNDLTPKQREATQGLLDGLPVEEVARRTGSNRNAVYKLIHDARMRLRNGFDRDGISIDDVTGILA
jgi:RNA polymerase sigma factor (sigma-70 family)